MTDFDAKAREHLRDAIESDDATETEYHVREALQMLEMDRDSDRHRGEMNDGPLR